MVTSSRRWRVVELNWHAMVTSSRRWRVVAMLIVVVLAKPPPGERGFLFVANRGALSDARSKHEGDLRYALRSACATGHPVRLVVETPAEASESAKGDLSYHYWHARANGDTEN